MLYRPKCQKMTFDSANTQKAVYYNVKHRRNHLFIDIRLKNVELSVIIKATDNLGVEYGNLFDRLRENKKPCGNKELDRRGFCRNILQSEREQFDI